MSGILCLLTGGPVQDIYVNGKRYFFEWHPHFGPAVVRRTDGAESVNQPGERSPFWNAVECWDRQGRRVEDGVAVWDAQPRGMG